jgi:hypothetical protein
MSDIFKDAYNAGRTDGERPETRNLGDEDAKRVIWAFFHGVKEKQEREAQDNGYGERLTTSDHILEATENIQGTEHGSILGLVLDGMVGLIADSGTTASAVMAVQDGTHGASFVLEVSDMNIIERYRVSVERVK